jgi:hypothetical protein
MKTVIEMAREAEFDELPFDDWTAFTHNIERFAALVRADEQEKYKWDVHSCGPTCKRYACVARREAVEATRNATLDEIAKKIEAMPFGDTAASFAVWIKEQKT